MADYSLTLDDSEIERYRLMADLAERRESTLWEAAGVAPGARIADVGCGPGALSVRLADLVGPGGEVWAVDRDADALAVASALAERSGVPVRTGTGSADATGLAEGTFDVVMLRHVLAHNGGREQAIVDHLAALARPGGGAVYLVDVDATGFRLRGAPAAYEEMDERYRELHRRRGNDLAVGTRLDELLSSAGLDVIAYEGHINVMTPPPGMRGPAWAARDALLAEGLVTADDIARWDDAFTDVGQDLTGLRFFGNTYVAVGRRA
ncbi:methyltransferase domain-containing protein [Streptomyces caniscabiei]|uniref:methyltransferase domain-containing protein n=1 Tax=Streptomyces caniscabiei TaxID=2746961 RepID=UPI0029BF3502|nr:methyltransferase domain-containing protein [Streptomyces caniscabiei]MDX2602427.1 methyltransferase domain-containing protein [Streptomyces caniscabiei]MDX2734283.1 methyltransferase domain-containing protein [Streptomyces caniscabiei]MDX2777059.1 methyltransferase domain-containing protein [Streptomyces caniscabiei]